MVEKSIIDWVASVLIIIGAVNWGLIGVGAGNLIENLIGGIAADIIYILVGLSGLWAIYLLTKKV